MDADQLVEHARLEIQQGRFAAGGHLLRQAALIRGQDAALWVDAARHFLQGGDLDEGSTALIAACVLAPGIGFIWSALAGLMIQNARTVSAVQMGLRANHLAPTADGAVNLAAAYRQAGLDQRAEQWAAIALALEPGFGTGWDFLSQLRQGRAPASARQAISHALQAGGPNAVLYSNYAELSLRLNQLEISSEFADKALALNPSAIAPRVILAKLAMAKMDWRPAVHILAQALAYDPEDMGAAIAMAMAAGRSSYYQPALDWSARAVRVLPGDALAWNATGIAQRWVGAAQASFDAFMRAAELAPDIRAASSNLVLAACYLPDDPGRDQAVLARFVRHLPVVSRPEPLDPRPDRPLRVGYLSADFRQHPVGIFLAPVLENHDQSIVLPILYASQTVQDSMTMRLNQSAPIRFVGGLEDTDLAQLIRNDGIDILVDLSGHTGGNRLGAVALRPAPILLTWGGLVGSTGLEVLDGILADPVQIPPDLASSYREPVRYLTPDYACFTPPNPAPPVSPSPGLTNPGLMFGCLNNILKITDQTIDLWSEILKRVPESHLLLKGPGFDFLPVQKRLGALFARHGVDPSRVILEGPAPSFAFLSVYGRIDIALDPLPYSGGLTTMEALWMGVPVLTLPGQRFTSRHSAAHLTAIGLENWIARDHADYIARAVELSRDREALSQLRAGLRDRMARSALCDGRSMARQVEAIYQDLWADLLDGRLN